MQVEVTAHARLHFGFLDLSGSADGRAADAPAPGRTAPGGRRFGGIGLSISKPRAVLRIAPAARLTVQGEQAEEIAALAERFCGVVGIEPRAAITVVEAIPRHVGFGSGTQTALALAAGLSRLWGLDLPPARLATIMDRARRSGVGYHAFQRGGFVVEGGHPSESATPDRPALPPPLLMRHEFPEDWRIVLMIPAPARTISGRDEEEAFRRLPPAAEESANRLSRIVLMRLLPALVQRRLPEFGAALSEAQEIVGAAFSAVQAGAFHPQSEMIVRCLKEAGACGVGQSSWGPAVYALAADDGEEQRLRSLALSVAPQTAILSARGLNRGAIVETQ